MVTISEYTVRCYINVFSLFSLFQFDKATTHFESTFWNPGCTQVLGTQTIHLSTLHEWFFFGLKEFKLQTQDPRVLNPFPATSPREEPQPEHQ